MGEGVVFTVRRQPTNNHHSRSADLSIDGRSAPWKQILTNVRIELGRMHPSGNVQLLYKLVMYHLEEAITNITGSEISDSIVWKDMSGYFGKSRSFFQMLAVAFSVDPSDHSIHHIFSAMVKGLSFTNQDWNSKKTYQTRSDFLLLILYNIGENLKKIDQKNYYDDVLGRGCGANMMNVYRILKGGGSSDEPDNHVSGEWKDRMRRVMLIVDTLESASVSTWIFGKVKNFMQEAVNKLDKLNLNNDKHWETVVNRLHGSVGLYFLASGIGGSTGTLFTGLHATLKAQLKGIEWSEIKGLDKRNEKIDSILKALGGYLDNVTVEIYNDILKGDGDQKMKEIAAILMDQN